MEMQLAPDKIRTYYFVVHTCDEHLAGTDADIFVTLYGEKGHSEEKRLNGYIEEDAFERNDYNCFSVPYEHEVGEVYKIKIHTDMSGSKPGWKCDYIHISTKKIDRWSEDCCQFLISEWIEDSSRKYEYTANRGYPYNVEKYTKDYQVVQSGELIVPPGVDYEKEVVTSVTVQVESSSLKTIDIETSAQLELDYKVVETDFEMRLNTTIEETTSCTIGQTIECRDRVTIAKKAKMHRRYALLWNEERYEYSVNMGTVNFQFAVPTDRKFAGLKFIEEY